MWSSMSRTLLRMRRPSQQSCNGCCIRIATSVAHVILLLSQSLPRRACIHGCEGASAAVSRCSRTAFQEDCTGLFRDVSGTVSWLALVVALLPPQSLSGGRCDGRFVTAGMVAWRALQPLWPDSFTHLPLPYRRFRLFRRSQAKYGRGLALS